VTLRRASRSRCAVASIRLCRSSSDSVVPESDALRGALSDWIFMADMAPYPAPLVAPRRLDSSSDDHCVHSCFAALSCHSTTVTRSALTSSMRASFESHCASPLSCSMSYWPSLGGTTLLGAVLVSKSDLDVGEAGPNAEKASLRIDCVSSFLRKCSSVWPLAVAAGSRKIV